MYCDYENRLSVTQADVRAAATYTSQRSIPLGAGGIRGLDLKDFYVKVDVAFAGGTSVEFRLVGSDNADGSGNIAVLATSGAIAEASLVAGKNVWSGKVPRKIPHAYLSLQAIGVGTHTAGTFSAGLAEHVPLRA